MANTLPDSNEATATASEEVYGEAPYPGSKQMPQWEVAELVEAPRFTISRWPFLLGPGLVMGASAIGGGEWLTGPLVTAKYGGALLWLSTLSILGQTLYNIEISRYTLYSGEPIFTGKFRTLPGPMFWLMLYIVLDLGSFLPYLASNAAIPAAAVLLRRLPDPAVDYFLLKGLACGIFLLALVPLVIGGKIFTSLKIVMSFKLIFVFGFLMFLAIFYSTADTWAEIVSGFFQFGTVPVQSGDGSPQTANVFTTFLSGETLPALDLSMIGILAAMAAISGNGGLTNTPISNYTRDQGWGMGRQVGAIPSIIGGHAIELSHVGKVFLISPQTLERWRGWVRHVQREQLAVWMPACFLGIALPSMLSVQFLTRGSAPQDKWQAAGMTAQGVADAVGPTWGDTFWYLTLFCGFLVLGTSTISTADGVLRRWVDVFWTASPQLQKWDTRHIGKFYFCVLLIYAAFGLVMLTLVKGDRLLVWSTNFYNYALGFSCWHTVAINSFLLPQELRPSILRRLLLIAAGLFFIIIAILTTMDSLGAFKA
jgi:Mn2+/Fe2+ NRAMP family transporter